MRGAGWQGTACTPLALPCSQLGSSPCLAKHTPWPPRLTPGTSSPTAHTQQLTSSNRTDARLLAAPRALQLGAICCQSQQKRPHRSLRIKRTCSRRRASSSSAVSCCRRERLASSSAPALCGGLIVVQQVCFINKLDQVKHVGRGGEVGVGRRSEWAGLERTQPSQQA